MKHLWFDPGEKTGWALFEDDRPVEMGELVYPTQLYQNLAPLIASAELVGYENYRINPPKMKTGYTPTWSTPVAVKVLGAIELASFLTNPDREFVVQEPWIKPSGYGYAGLPRYDPKKKGMHMQDAIAHGAYWWMEEGCKRAQRQSQNPT